MTKEQFTSIMEEFVIRRRDYLEWIDGIEDVLGGAWESIMEHSFENLLVKTIGEALGGDEDDWLGYFLYERDGEWFDIYLSDNEGTDQEECRIVQIDSFDKLYDLIKGGHIE